MRGHSLWFKWERRKIILQLSSNTPSYLKSCLYLIFGHKTGVFLPRTTPYMSDWWNLAVSFESPSIGVGVGASLTTKKQTTKFLFANYKKKLSPSWAISSRSTLFAESAIFVPGTERVKVLWPFYVLGTALSDKLSYVPIGLVEFSCLWFLLSFLVCDCLLKPTHHLFLSNVFSLATLR